MENTELSELSDCDYCHEKYDYAKRFWRWDFNTCSVKCLHKISSSRIKEEARQEEVRAKKYHIYAQYAGGPGSC